MHQVKATNEDKTDENTPVYDRGQLHLAVHQAKATNGDKTDENRPVYDRGQMHLAGTKSRLLTEIRQMKIHVYDWGQLHLVVYQVCHLFPFYKTTSL